MNSYPSLIQVLSPHPIEQTIRLGHDEDWRAEIAQIYGLEALAIRDQQMRVLAELGVADRGTAEMVLEKIDAARSWFMFKGFPRGAAPSPEQIEQSIRKMADGARAIAEGLALIRVARTGVQNDQGAQARELQRIHMKIIEVLAASALPRELGASESIDAVRGSVRASRTEFYDPWTIGWEQITHHWCNLAETVNTNDLKNPARQIPQEFTDFVHRLGAIYLEVKNRRPRADRRKATQPDDWHTPFVRFFREVWPLTAEGSQGHPPPEDGQIGRALGRTPSF